MDTPDLSPEALTKALHEIESHVSVEEARIIHYAARLLRAQVPQSEREAEIRRLVASTGDVPDYIAIWWERAPWRRRSHASAREGAAEEREAIIDILKLDRETMLRTGHTQMARGLFRALMLIKEREAACAPPTKEAPDGR